MTATSYAGSMSKPAGSCRCGGAGSAGCGCGPGSVMVASGSLRRPRFFAGQLLTEDDLGLLDAYVVAKNRLHNRYLFGDGVVCGLRVSCHDCDDGMVTVEPGYALDCCGNDLVVPCATELDVLDLIRDLRLEEGGADCGDPCADPSGTVGGTVEGTTGAAGGDLRQSKGGRDGVRRHYCLYLRYTEQLEDPVAPYATDQACDGPCEPTRVAEGHRFELRCGPHHPDPRPNVVQAIIACFGDLRDLGLQLGRGLKHQQLGNAITAAEQAMAEDAPFAVEAATVEQLRSAVAVLESVEIGAAGDDADTSYRLVENVRLLRQQLALLGDAPAERRAELGVEDAELATARDLLDSVIEQVPVEQVLGRFETHDRASAAAVLRLDDPQADAHQVRLSHNLLKAGVAFDTQARFDYEESLDRIREWLLLRLEKSSTVTSCRLWEEVAAIRVDTTADVGSDRWARGFLRAAAKLFAAFIQYLIDCICAAMNPPCVTCDDDAVLLACLEVEDCVVVDICNQARSNVLAPTSMRYWLGAHLDLLARAMEFLCCEFSLRMAYQKPNVVDTGDGKAHVPVYYTEFAEPSSAPTAAVSNGLGLSAASATTVDAIIRGYQRTTSAGGGSPLEALGLRQLASPLEASALAIPGIEALADSALQGPINRVVGTRIKAGVSAEAVAELVDTAVTEASGQVTGDIDRLTNQVNGLKGQSTRVRNELLDRLEQVTAELRDARDKLTELEARMEE